MFSVQDHFPGTFPATFFRDGFRYNFRDVPQTRFSDTFSGGVFGDVSGYVVSGCVSRDVIRSRVSYTVPDTFFRYVFPGDVLPEPFLRTCFETFPDTFADAFSRDASPESFPWYVFQTRFLTDFFASVAVIARRVKYHS